MANEITYDVYTLAKGRWILDTRFKKHQRERAIDEGKQLEKQPGIEGVKVVREIYEESDSLISEKVVYKTKGAEAGPKGEGVGSNDEAIGPAGASSGGGGSWVDEADTMDEAPSGGMFKRKTKVAKSGGGAAASGERGGGLRRTEFVLVYKMIIIGAISFAFAALTTFIYATTFI